MSNWWAICFKECTLFNYVLFIGVQWTAVGRREGGKEGGMREETAYAHVNIAAVVSVLCVPRC